MNGDTAQGANMNFLLSVFPINTLTSELEETLGTILSYPFRPVQGTQV